MEDKYSRVSGKDVINATVRELERAQGKNNFDDNVYILPDEHDTYDSFDPDKTIENVEELRKYVVARIDTINAYHADLIKEKSLISVFNEIYRFATKDDFDEFNQPLIDELIDYIYDNSVYPPHVADEIAYSKIMNKTNKKR